MIKDNRGQIALEYLLIFTISMILLIVFTLPLAEITIEDTFDVSDTLNAKSDLAKISQAIQQVYGEGQGAKQSVVVDSKKAIKVNVGVNSLSTTLKLHDGSDKVINIGYTSKLSKTSISLNKGVNTIVVEWPVNSVNMRIYKI